VYYIAFCSIITNIQELAQRNSAFSLSDASADKKTQDYAEDFNF